MYRRLSVLKYLIHKNHLPEKIRIFCKTRLIPIDTSIQALRDLELHSISRCIFGTLSVFLHDESLSRSNLYA